jgi:hypothetical protein
VANIYAIEQIAGFELRGAATLLLYGEVHHDALSGAEARRAFGNDLNGLQTRILVAVILIPIAR